MSFLSGSTKKVSVYGRKAEVRVVNRHSTFTTVESDENDPFGFFPTQTKPKSTYGRSRASVLPSQLLRDSTEAEMSEADDTLESQSATDRSAAYDTANSSLSFESACSSSAATNLTTKSTSGGQRKALASKALNAKDAPTRKSTTKSTKSPIKPATDQCTAITTPRAKRVGAKRGPTDSPQTVRKAPQPKASVPSNRNAALIPTESTPPPAQPAGRAPRRAAQAARMAIEDYDFTDKDMTPRRPVPTKSYFVEKAKQLAEWAREDEEEAQRQKSEAEAARSAKTSASGASKNSRKSVAARPRHTPALGASRASAIAISDSSLSSATGMSDSSFEGGTTSGSSFSLVIPRYEGSNDAAPKRSTAKASKAKQNKRITRRIAASSEDEDEDPTNAGELGSDEEADQDPALKLAAQVADLAIADADASDSYLSDLLATVSQSKAEPFADTVQRLRTTIGHSTSGPTKTTKTRRRIEKIGEASYSEVFKIFAPSSNTSPSKTEKEETLVLKIIPIASNASSDDDELPFSSPAADVEREIRLMQLIEQESTRTATNAFVSLHSAHVVKGAYPSALLQAWDRWDAKRRAKTGEGAENIRPDVLGSQQVYALLVMTDGGMDLESLKVKSWLQATSIFWQVLAGLSEMETRIEFEHRDLHWGNILVQSVAPVEPSTQRSKTSGQVSNWMLDPNISGVKATIIDFTLSRAAIPPKGRAKKSEVLYYPFDDESLFEGTGDPQFDVYREMRTVTNGDWASHMPNTNILWLRYLARKLIDVKCKGCKTPKPASGDAELQREIDAYTSLQAAAARLDQAAKAALGQKQGKVSKPAAGRKSVHPRARKSVAPSVAVSSARKGRATMAAMPILHDQVQEDEIVALRSAAELMTILDQ